MIVPYTGGRGKKEKGLALLVFFIYPVGRRAVTEEEEHRVRFALKDEEKGGRYKHKRDRVFHYD